jgi:hypothetical protein
MSWRYWSNAPEALERKKAFIFAGEARSWAIKTPVVRNPF